MHRIETHHRISCSRFAYTSQWGKRCTTYTVSLVTDFRRVTAVYTKQKQNYFHYRHTTQNRTTQYSTQCRLHLKSVSGVTIVGKVQKRVQKRRQHHW
jgi:hypothetical protein